MMRSTLTLPVLVMLLLFPAPEWLEAGERLPIPDHLVVLTFDDGNKSDLYHVAPLLKKYGSGAIPFYNDMLPRIFLYV